VNTFFFASLIILIASLIRSSCRRYYCRERN